MQTTSQHLPPLAEYLGIRDAQEGLHQQYPTLDSFRWFVRRHRDHLAASGAMILVAGRQKFHPNLTEQAVVEIGRQAAIAGRAQ